MAQRDRKKCPRIPSKNVDVNRIPKGTKIVDCGNLWIAKLKGGAAVVFWGGQEAREAQRRLAAASRRGTW